MSSRVIGDQPIAAARKGQRAVQHVAPGRRETVQEDDRRTPPPPPRRRAARRRIRLGRCGGSQLLTGSLRGHQPPSIVTRRINTGAFGFPLARPRAARSVCTMSKPLAHPPDQRVVRRQPCIGDRDDEELAAGPPGGSAGRLRHRDDALRVGEVPWGWLVDEVPGPAAAGSRRVTALDHEARHDPVERACRRRHPGAPDRRTRRPSSEPGRVSSAIVEVAAARLDGRGGRAVQGRASAEIGRTSLGAGSRTSAQPAGSSDAVDIAASPPPHPASRSSTRMVATAVRAVIKAPEGYSRRLR